MRPCRRRSPPRRGSGSPPGRTSTPRASGCRRGRPGMRSSRRSTTGARAGRAGSSGATPTEAARGSFARLVGVPPSTVAVGATVSGLVGLVASSLPDGIARPRAGRGVHLDALSLPRPGAPRCGGSHGPRRRARRGDRRLDRRRRVQRRADGDRRGGRPRRDRRCGEGARCADARRRDPGLRVASARRVRVRRRRRGGLQVAALAARHGVHGGRAGAARRGSSPPRPAGSPARTCTPRTSAGRCGSRPMPGGSTPLPPGTAGSAPHRRSRCSRRSASARSTRTTSGWQTASGRASGSSRATRRSCSSTRPDAAARLERAGIRAAVRGGRVRTSWHLYNTGADVDRALEALT